MTIQTRKNINNCHLGILVFPETPIEPLLFLLLSWSVWLRVWWKSKNPLFGVSVSYFTFILISHVSSVRIGFFSESQIVILPSKPPSLVSDTVIRLLSCFGVVPPPAFSGFACRPLQVRPFPRLSLRSGIPSTVERVTYPIPTGRCFEFPQWKVLQVPGGPTFLSRTKVKGRTWKEELHSNLVQSRLQEDVSFRKYNFYFKWPLCEL